MRQFAAILLSIGALAAFGQTPVATPETPANKSIDLAKEELGRVEQLVQAGALPRLRLEEAQQNLEDAQDEAILDRTLYGDLPVDQVNDQLTDEMVAAAQRRVERGQTQLAQAQKLVTDGIAAQSMLTPIQEELAIRRMNLNLAHSRASLLAEMAALAKYQKTAAEIHEVTSIIYRDSFIRGMEHYEGSGLFRESKDLKPLALAFEQKFEHPLPISAEGETNLHRTMGFDHRGRVDVAVSPNAPEGIWLLRYLKARKIPFYAFTRAIPGKATAAHIHIGPGSTRLHTTASAD
jgi:parvulin-like peptidyl-prolyl isomerase